MQNFFLIAAVVLYLVCAALPSRRATLISAMTALAWLLHGAGLWFDLASGGTIRIGFAAMLSSAQSRHSGFCSSAPSNASIRCSLVSMPVQINF